MKLFQYLESINKKFNSQQYGDYMGGAVAAIRALTKGDTIGIITARANKAGHEPLIQAIEDQLSLELGKIINIDREKVHFVNDKNFISKVGDANSNTYTRKANVILSYILDDNSEYEKIKFYDDDNRNLEAVRSEILKKKNEIKKIIINQLSNLRNDKDNIDLKNQLEYNRNILKKFKNIILKLYDIKEFDNTKLNDMQNAKDGIINTSKKKVLHLFDIDDTLVVVPSKIHIKVGEKITKSLSPDELTRYVPNEDEKLDFTDFIDPEQIKKTVRQLKNTKENIFKQK
jgi:hypothetical protein